MTQFYRHLRHWHRTVANPPLDMLLLHHHAAIDQEDIHHRRSVHTQAVEEVEFGRRVMRYDRSDRYTS